MVQRVDLRSRSSAGAGRAVLGLRRLAKGPGRGGKRLMPSSKVLSGGELFASAACFSLTSALMISPREHPAC